MWIFRKVIIKELKDQWNGTDYTAVHGNNCIDI